MIKFLFKGLLRDRSRSLFPIITVAVGVFLTVFLVAFMGGALASMYNNTAHNSSGHVKIMTRAYAAESDQIPNDLAYIGVEDLLLDLRQRYPDMLWLPRIRFGGLLDVADVRGETQAQGPASGLAVDFSPDSPEMQFLNLAGAVVQGRLPRNSGEILLSDEFAQKLGLTPGSPVTLIGSTMYGSMTVSNFTVAGTVHFGVAAMDRGSVLADIRDIQRDLDMPDTAGEILGFFASDVYDDAQALALVKEFNALYADSSDEFAPVMRAMLDDSGLRDYMEMAMLWIYIIIIMFVGVMALVLWNAGLIGGIRRYGEMGVRLAIGENKMHIYLSSIAEALIVGLLGSIIGTFFGLLLAYWLQEHGINYGAVFKNSSIMISSVMKAAVTPQCYYIGFIPGVVSTFIGSALAGLGIFKRQTAQLFKELET
ncbi:MAG: ABC transporter permease [Candidatus Margulisbacteria bacterium]|jgi:putative ABC transport system permease protein|nr:ABC transporter permease [Candidatus Margulisiibacteriota bacterium]